MLYIITGSLNSLLEGKRKALKGKFSAEGGLGS